MRRRKSSRFTTTSWGRFKWGLVAAWIITKTTRRAFKPSDLAEILGMESGTEPTPQITGIPPFAMLSLFEAMDTAIFSECRERFHAGPNVKDMQSLINDYITTLNVKMQEAERKLYNAEKALAWAQSPDAEKAFFVSTQTPVSKA